MVIGRLAFHRSSDMSGLQLPVVRQDVEGGTMSVCSEEMSFAFEFVDVDVYSCCL